MPLRGKTVLVVGAARSGLESCRFLLARGARVILSDSKSLEQLGPELKELEKRGVTLLLGNQLPRQAAWDLVVVSPGVPPMIPLLSMSRAAGVEVIGELELAYRFAQAPFLAVTGTNGKTTTTALLGQFSAGELRRVQAACRRASQSDAGSSRPPRQHGSVCRGQGASLRQDGRG